MKILFTFLFFLIQTALFAQENNLNAGTLYGDLFLNANHNFAKSQTSFRLNRLHFGYKYQFTDKLYFNGMIESAREDYEPKGDYNQITNLFEFCMGFNFSKVEGKFGLIGTEFNQQQEKLWKHRYVDKVFADKYGFAPTNDFGLLVIYKPSEILNLDIAITNGEGHKTYQADSAFRYAAGISLKPKNGLVARIYGDMIYYPDLEQSNLIGILGYNADKFTVGIEYNQQFNSNGMNNYQRNGISAYLSYNIVDKIQAFGRYDILKSNKPTGYTNAWNLANDGRLIIAGVQYELSKNIGFASNYRTWMNDFNNDTKSYIFFDIFLSF